MDVVVFVVAMAALVYGADFIIKEAEKIAIHFDIPHFIIGATIVGFGTSLPELAGSVSATLKDSDDIAVANAVGSNIFNIALVLGLTFLIAKKIEPKRDVFAKDSAWILFPIVAFILTAYDGEFSRIDGVLLLIMMGAYILFLLKDARDDIAELDIDESEVKNSFGWFKAISLLLVGFVLVVGGADFAIDSASNIAYGFGISEWIVGIFLVAFGTSLPELVVSIQAARKNNADMSIGNIIGSNISNIFVVIGGAALVSPLSFNLQANIYDVMLMVFVTIMLVFIAATRLYNKSAGIGLLVIFALLILHNVEQYL
ncbi:MAG: calcium/sodium antiporter [Campylobacterales bacterium]